MLIYDKNEVISENSQVKKVIIAVDFKSYSENIANFALNFLRGLPAEITLFHSLQSKFTKEEAEQKMTDFLINLKASKYCKAYFSFKTIIYNANAASSIEILNNRHHNGLVIMGSNNNPDSKILGKIAKDILFETKSNFLIIPPQAEVRLLHNVGILAENSLESLPFMNVFRRYLRCQDVFVNLVLFKEYGEIDSNDVFLIKNYQNFFSENFVFPTIYESIDLLEVMCQNIPNSNLDFFGICWDENTKVFQALLEHDFQMVPSFLKIPMFISKEKQILETKKVLEEVLA